MKVRLCDKIVTAIVYVITRVVLPATALNTVL